MSFTLRPRFLPDRDALKEWGGKGASLVRMIRKGYPVPPSAAMGLTQVQEWLQAMPEFAPAIAAWRKWDERALPLLVELQAAILRAPMPEHWTLSANTLRMFLCGDTENETAPWPLLLRSSMSVEDGSVESLAGCFESVRISQTTPENLWQGFLKVVASAFAASSAERLMGAGIDPAEFRVGVLIQPYLIAELAGVCFSRDPLNPWDRNGSVEWVRGAGEALVQGTGQAQQRSRSDGPSAEVAPFWDRLWKRADAAEKLVGGPSDLEWVWDGHQLWFVQARPIATEEARLAARAPSRRWTRELTLERFPEPMTPMGWSALGEAFVSNLASLDRRFGVIAKNPSDVAVSVRGIVYSDPKFFAFPGGVSIRWSKYLNPLTRAPWVALSALLKAAGRAVFKGSRYGAGLSRALLKLDLIDALLGAQAYQIQAEWDHHRDQGLERLERFKPTIDSVADPVGVLERIGALSEISLDFMEPDLAVYLIKDSTHKALLAVWGALGLPMDTFSDLFRSFEGNRTTEMNGEWSDCVRALREDSGCAAFIRALEEAHSFEQGIAAASSLTDAHRALWQNFLERNGHSTTSWDLATPTWADDPARLAPLLKASISAPDSLSRKVAVSELREAGRLQLAQVLRARVSRRAALRILLAVDRLESFMRIDEEHHFLSGSILIPSRKLVLAGGSVLAGEGLLESKNEVFFLMIAELRAALSDLVRFKSLRLLARRRQSEWERAKKMKVPFELPATRILPTALSLQAGQWQGSPMSPGIATGRALIAEHIDQVHGIEPGTILITTSPNPALTPLYPLLGGLVSVTGSALSHGFVSAREYALPAVSGIAGITELIANGAMVRVDGSSGKVEVLS